jgi:hypothetical protein
VCSPHRDAPTAYEDDCLSVVMSFPLFFFIVLMFLWREGAAATGAEV